MPKKIALTALSLFLLLPACEQQKPSEELTLTPAAYSQLPGWDDDNFAEAGKAFVKSCARIMRRAPEVAFGPMKEAGTYGDWQAVCKKFDVINHQSDDAVKSFFEENFKPFSVAAGKEVEGLFTGYYEAHLHGSLKKSGPFSTPLYARPDDLVMVNLGEFRESLKGQRIAGRVSGGQLKPYESRSQIVANDWPHNDKVLLWVDDPVDAFFVQIQGSGVVELPDGQTLRIGYAGQNGHPYFAIGRELIARGALTKENVSMQSIRAWLEHNPDEAHNVMNTNASYVFFRILDGDGPLGGEGVALTAERSLAIDRTLVPYGAPLWLAADAPEDGEAPLKRLMVAQDTGGAIRGAVRGDVFWGFGARAEHLAGKMKSRGQYWILLPASLYEEL